MKAEVNTVKLIEAELKQYEIDYKKGKRELLNKLKQEKASKGIRQKASASTKEIKQVLVAIGNDPTVNPREVLQGISESKDKPNYWVGESLGNKPYGFKTAHNMAVSSCKPLRRVIVNGGLKNEKLTGLVHSSTLGAAFNGYKRQVLESIKIDGIESRLCKVEDKLLEAVYATEQNKLRLDLLEKGQSIQSKASELLEQGLTQYRVHKLLKGQISLGTVNKLAKQLRDDIVH